MGSILVMAGAMVFLFGVAYSIIGGKVFEIQFSTSYHGAFVMGSLVTGAIMFLVGGSIQLIHLLF